LHLQCYQHCDHLVEDGGTIFYDFSSVEANYDDSFIVDDRNHVEVQAAGFSDGLEALATLA